jgi:hypothetical protein
MRPRHICTRKVTCRLIKFPKAVTCPCSSSSTQLVSSTRYDTQPLDHLCTHNPSQVTITIATMAFGLKSTSMRFYPHPKLPLSYRPPLLARCTSAHQSPFLSLSMMFSLFSPYTHPSAVILLAFVLAAGFLLVILSCALWNNWLPLLVGMLFISPFL